MSTFVYYQLYVFLATFYGGIVIGFMYDVYKIYRSILKTKKIIAAIQDILFWIAISIVVIYVLVYSDDGNVRGYYFIGFLLGALIYNLLLSRIVVKTIKMFLKAIQRIFHRIYMGIKRVMDFLYRVIKYPCKKIYKALRPLILRLKKILSIPKRMIKDIEKYTKTIFSKK
ncbi:MAG: spore cortex biosynthesis protein YabQ [Maledivibacter sp.]|jgi:spore cortex biosynthesis protein YabQ|nr:spore cortex biosynthesis protein YabQ [Maledivibacter sp.]